MKRWYVVYTRTGMERLALGHLETQGYTVYLPQRLKERRHARRIDNIKVPLFPRYLFVLLDTESERWHSINGTHGVSYLVTMGEQPSAVPSGIVDAIRQRENDEGLVEVAEPVPYNTGDVVEITRGAFADQTGIFRCGDDKQRITLLLSLLGREMEIQLPANTVRAYG
jgi:transcriptional antiterminator RfaH